MNTDSLSYTVVGQGPPLLLLHGFLGSKQDWSFLIPEFSKHFCLVIPDLPGFGGSRNFDLQKRLDYDSIGELIINLLNKLAVSTSNLIGYSMGGRISLSLALKYPQRFSKLILVSANPGIEEIDLRQERLAKDSQLSENIKVQGLESFLSKWYQAPLFNGLFENKELYQPMIDRRLKENDADWASKVIVELSPGNVPSMWHRIPELSRPTCYMAGSKDTKYIEILQQIAKLNPSIATKVIENAGHNACLEQPQDFCKLAAKFLF